jgi:hypothetical protein
MNRFVPRLISVQELTNGSGMYRRVLSTIDHEEEDALNRGKRNLRTTDNKEPLARKLHSMLLSIGPDAGDECFASAVELLSLDQTNSREPDDFRLDAFIAVQSVAQAISNDAWQFERNRLLLHAVNCAHSWLNARRLPDSY